MSLRAAKRNARRSVNYNLSATLPPLSNDTLAQMLARGQALLDVEADLGRPEFDDDRILMIEGPENHNDIEFGG